MSSGKKGKKSKGKTLALNDFLADTPGGLPSIPLKSINWADEVEDEHDGYMSRTNKEPVVLPTAPRAAREPGFNEENIPTHPPFVAYVSNLPYDIAEEDLAYFFEGMNISSMRLPKESNKLRGYGYVEFEDRQSLVDALAMTDATLQSRRIRIEVSNSSNDERRGSRMGRDNRRDGGFEDSELRTSGDWRSGPRDDGPSDGDRFRGRGGFENRDRKDEREETDNTPGAWRSGGDRGRPAFRERGGEDRERNWGSSRYGGDRGSRDRDGDRDRDRGGSGFGPRRNYGGDSTWDRDRTQSRPSASEPDSSEPRTRTKLNLIPRTKPVEKEVLKYVAADENAPESDRPVESSASDTDATPVSVPVPAVKIFGAAKPVDTAAREREIEERLNKTYADSKAKEEPEAEKRVTREGGTWGRRNGVSSSNPHSPESGEIFYRKREGRDEKEKPRPTWRSEDDRGRPSERPERRIERNIPPYRSEQRGDSRGPPTSRGAPPLNRGSKPAETRAPPPERERKEKDRDERDDISRMPKAKEDQTPNFVASNKYSMLPDDVDPDIIED